MAFSQSHPDSAPSALDRPALNDCDGKPAIPVSYRTGHVAKLLGVSGKTVTRWCAEGKLPALRVSPRGHWRVLTEGLQRQYHALVAEVPAANDCDDDEF